MEIGELIRDLRTTVGMSQGRLADALCQVSGVSTVTREEVSRWERGKRTPSAYWLRHLAAVLDVPIHLLEGAKVRRRQFITDVATTAIASLVASDLIESGFSAALNRGDSPSVDEWHALLDQYGRDYMTSGAAEIQRRLAGDLVLLQQELSDAALWAVAARLMTVYGKTIPGADGAKAVRWYLMATKAADRSGDTMTRVWVRGRGALALGYEGASLPIANRMASEALQIDDRPSLGRLNAVMAQAHVAALTGEHEISVRLLEEGRGIFEQVGSDEQQSDYAVPEWRMGVFTSLLLARLGDEKGALDAQDTALKILPPTLPRFATHLEMHKGLMLAKAGARQEGVAYARAALDRLPPERHSLTLRMLMREVELGRAPV